ncbi:hypothetical protein DH2020_023399 [Rehmannia glutinosa]|uniref:F-box domain-containing protein n=1 Tax=Rehmannia glutinosa TaxID=99300 RepID=A0ABR0W8I2_REHGL
MSRRVRKRVEGWGKEKVDFTEIQNNLTLDEKRVVDWTGLPDDTVITVFSRLNNHDRASLSSTCRTWRTLGKSPCLWQVLDLGTHNLDAVAASSLASRCENLWKLQFRGIESADAIINLQAKNLWELSGDSGWNMTDATLCMLAARHEALECLQIGPDLCQMISSDAVKVIAICCPQLKKLWISGIDQVDGNAINALAKHCRNLADIGFTDCPKVDETALGNVASVRFLSIAGISNINWNLVVQEWSKLPHLIGLDVSRTDICPNTVLKIFSSSFSLKVLCALNCPALEEDATLVSNDNHKGKVLLAVFMDILNGVAKLFVDMPKNNKNIFLQWRNSNEDEKLGEILNWLEWIISNSLLRVSEINPPSLENFWLNQGTTLLLSFMQSAQEEVQEWAATALATIVTDDDNIFSDTGMAEAVMLDDGIRLLLNLAQSWREGLQSETAKAIANLLGNAKVAKAVSEEGGISILINLARSTDGERVLEHVVGALANLVGDDRCSTGFASIGGVHALVTLVRSCKVGRVQEEAARALANFASHGDTNCNAAAVGQEAGALDALVQLTRSCHDGVRQEAAAALWNLSSDDRNQEVIVAAGGVEALVALAHSCLNASRDLQERAVGALWGLAASEVNSIAIGREGGVAPLIALARSDAEEVHETAAGALWNLAFDPGNAFRIVDEGGVPALVHLCSSSASKMARFMSALALSSMFDERMNEIALIGISTEGTSKSVDLDGDDIETHRRFCHDNF